MFRICLLLFSAALGLYPPPCDTCHPSPPAPVPLVPPTAQAPAPPPPTPSVPPAPALRPDVAPPAYPQAYHPPEAPPPGRAIPVYATPAPVPTPPAPPASAAEPRIPPSTVMVVANVHKEPVLLFQVRQDGELIFLQKVPPGEAIDLSVSQGYRYTAVFQTAPYQTSIVVKEANTTWLLRPAGSGSSLTPPVVPASGASLPTLAPGSYGVAH